MLLVADAAWTLSSAPGTMLLLLYSPIYPGGSSHIFEAFSASPPPSLTPNVQHSLFHHKSSVCHHCQDPGIDANASLCSINNESFMVTSAPGWRKSIDEDQIASTSTILLLLLPNSKYLLLWKLNCACYHNKCHYSNNYHSKKHLRS